MVGKGDDGLSSQFQLEAEEELQAQDPMIFDANQQDLYGARTESEMIAFTAMRAPKGGRGRGRSRVEDDDERQKKKKKMQHRERERQRRQEMAALFSSLRSLLPLDHVKGKRSVSEHIAESAKYIRQMEGRIKELGDKREQLLSTQPPSSSSTATATATASSIIVNNVQVLMSSSSGVHVQITCPQDAPLLSASLKLLLQSGLDVLTCVTNRLPPGSGGALLHNIHCHPTHHPGFPQPQLHHLQNALYHLISSHLL